MNNRGRPEKLTDELKRWIANHQRDRKRKLKAPEIRQDLRAFIEKKVRKEVAERGLNWAQDWILEEVERILPGSSRIQKYLRELNPRLEKESELNTPWHMGCMIEHQLPPEAIPYILLAQDYARKYPDPVFNTLPQDPVTIRQAQWIARLYAIVGDIHRLKGYKKVRATAWLYRSTPVSKKWQ